MVWVVIDDLLGPGAAINEAATFHIKNIGTQERGIAAMYNGSWWSIVLLEVFLCYWTNNVYTTTLLIISTAATWFLWNKVGRRKWIGRGKGVNLVNVRSGYAMVFGQGPEGPKIVHPKVVRTNSLDMFGDNTRRECDITWTFVGCIYHDIREGNFTDAWSSHS